MALAQEQLVREAQSRDSRWRIWPARVGWVLVFILITAIFIESAPSATVYERRHWEFAEAVPAIQPYLSTFTFAAIMVAARVVSLAIFYAVALLIAFRKWNDWFALFVSTALLMTAWGFVARGDTYTYIIPEWLSPLEPLLEVPFQGIFLLCWLLLFFLLPDGRFVPRWSAWFVALPILGTISLFSFEFFVRDIPPQHRELAGNVAWSVFITLFLAAILAGLFSQIYRYQNVATPTQRQQMKWVLFGLAVQPLPILFGVGGISGSGPWSSLFNLFFQLFMVTLLPVSIGLAVFRRRLWDVDPLINRSVVYGGLTAFILILYALVVGGASTLLQTQERAVSILIATIAALFIVPIMYRKLNQAINQIHPVAISPDAAARSRIGEPVANPFETVLHGRALSLARLAWLLVFALCLALLIAGTRTAVAVDLYARMTLLAGEYDIAIFRVFAGNQFLSSDLLKIVAYIQLIAFWAVGLLIFRRRSDDWQAILASIMCLSIGVGFTPNLMFLPILRPEWQLPATLQQMVTFTSLIVFMLVFPNGRFVPRWAWFIALGWVAYSVLWLFIPELNPHQSSAPVSLLILIVGMAFCLAAQIYRYRRVSNPVEKQQSKWVLTGVLTTHICFFLLVTLSVAGVTPRLELLAPTPVRLLNMLWGLSAILIPISIAFAFFRTRLWEIDLYINRAIVYGSLTVMIVLFYVVVVGLFGNAVRFENNLALSILATGLIAVLFNSVRVRLQRTANQLLYGDRDDPFTVMSELGRQLERTATPGETLAGLVENIRRSLKLPYVAVTARTEAVGEVVAESGDPASEFERFPLAYQSQPMGELLIGHRSPGETFTSKERRLLNNIARQAGAVVYTAQLTDYLQHSREQLVLAREEERRRLQRDLHDGLGPQLATLSTQLDVARNLAATGSPEVVALLAKLSAEAQGAIGDIRRLVYGLRPPALDQLGLAAAVREYVSGQNITAGPHITLDIPDVLPLLPAAVEVGAYRIVQEAVANCLRHSGATDCRIRIANQGGLIVEVKDDGRGIPAVGGSGVGLGSMRERAEELGGAFRVESQPGIGTQIQAFFPLAQDY